MAVLFRRAIHRRAFKARRNQKAHVLKVARNRIRSHRDHARTVSIS